MPHRRQQGEGSVYSRDARDGRSVQWIAVADLGWKAGRRDRREFTAATPAEAIEKRAVFLDRRRDGFTLPRGRQPTVAEWVLHWCHHTAKTRVSGTSWYSSYRPRCEDYIAPYFEKIKLTDLSAEDIEGWHAWLLARPRQHGGGTIAASTVGVTHSILSAALKEAVRRKRLPANPCSMVSPPHADRPSPEPPTADELDLVMAACASWPRGARWVLAITTGLRQGEALGLRWRDVRLRDPASVSVRQSLARLDGEWVYKEPKSAKSRRTVPLPQITVKALGALQSATAVREVGGLVFTRPGGEPVHAHEDWLDWQRLLESIGLPPYRVHDLRHAYATELLEQGEDPRVVQELLGWSTVAMAEIYSHVRPVTHARVVSSLNRRFSS